jgi:phosphoribosylformylglycinamidine synthase
VQRGNAEIQRRAQEVIDRCWQLGTGNPILSIHDVGAGGLSNAFPELVHGGGAGARLELRKIPSEEPGMAPREIWCNEAQERYVLAIRAQDLERFRTICQRERCPFAVVGSATVDKRLVITDAELKTEPVDMDLDILLGKPPRMSRNATHVVRALAPLDPRASRSGTLHIARSDAGDGRKASRFDWRRTVGGLCSRDQMVGPWRLRLPMSP